VFKTTLKAHGVTKKMDVVDASDPENTRRFDAARKALEATAA
jgi:hypothetical protein